MFSGFVDISNKNTCFSNNDFDVSLIILLHLFIVNNYYIYITNKDISVCNMLVFGMIYY